MPSLNGIMMILMAALFASLTIASPIDVTIESTPTIKAREDYEHNGWMEWYQEGVQGAVRYVGWVDNVCQTVPDALTDDWTSENTDVIKPPAWYHATCHVNTEPDCSGKWSAEFTARGMKTNELFGNGHVKYKGFKCTCGDKCPVPSEVSAPPFRVAEDTSPKHPARPEPATAFPFSHAVATPAAKSIEARDDPLPNGWMYWYQNGVGGYVRVSPWTDKICQPVPDASGTHWTTDHTDWMRPAPGYNADCWVNTMADCSGEWGHKFTSDTIATKNVFGKGHYKPYYGFMCYCYDKCKVPDDIAKPPAKMAFKTSPDQPPVPESAAAAAPAPRDVANISDKPIEARDDGSSNGWMRWYCAASTCDGPVVQVGWTDNVCQAVPDARVSDPKDKDNWAAYQSDYIMPSEGSNGHCWAYSDVDCKGQQSIPFDEDGEWTYNLFGKPRPGPNRPHFSFLCTCVDKCTTPSDIAKPPARRAALGAGAA